MFKWIGYVPTVDRTPISRMRDELSSTKSPLKSVEFLLLFKGFLILFLDFNLDIKFFKSFHSWGRSFCDEISTRDSPVLFCSMAVSIDQRPKFCSPPPVIVSDLPIRVKYSWTGCKTLFNLFRYTYTRLKEYADCEGVVSRYIVNVSI